MQKGFSQFILTVLVATAVVAGIFLAKNKQNTSTLTPIEGSNPYPSNTYPPTSVAAYWKTYDNKIYTIKVPLNWEVSSGVGGCGPFLVTKEKDVKGWIAICPLVGESTLDDVVKKSSVSYNPSGINDIKTISQNDILIDNHKAVKLEIIRAGLPEIKLIIDGVSDKSTEKTGVVSVDYYIQDKDISPEKLQEARDIFDSIVSTIKFTQ